MHLYKQGFLDSTLWERKIERKKQRKQKAVQVGLVVVVVRANEEANFKQ